MSAHVHPKMQVSRGWRDEQLQRAWERPMDGVRRKQAVLGLRHGAAAVGDYAGCIYFKKPEDRFSEQGKAPFPRERTQGKKEKEF